jgi:hypothetical protein
MNKLALLAAILFTLVSGRSAEAITIFSDYFFLYTPTGSSTVTASGEFTVDPTFRELLSATGDINGSPITGVSGTHEETRGGIESRGCGPINAARWLPTR